MFITKYRLSNSQVIHYTCIDNMQCAFLSSALLHIIAWAGGMVRDELINTNEPISSKIIESMETVHEMYIKNIGSILLSYFHHYVIKIKNQK